MPIDKSELKTDRWFERACASKEFRPIAKVTEDDGTEILVALGGPFEAKSDDEKADYADCGRRFYQGLWHLKRGTHKVGGWVDFAVNHDLNLTERAREEGRLNATLAAAQDFIRKEREADEIREWIGSGGLA